ncbi:MAG: hemolysin III family protein [Meiothermus sp.]|uniref:PAQR family membrane homeostasis protein TrhA n=1 Tax=Meiothermus sp. TaxID=1955249 RepID=UPI0025EF2981|nr:hemolysin III family protein [Meiothermus sp.]MCS7194897.1 hemolysin III family protein [Meiothermus sp.]
MKSLFSSTAREPFNAYSHGLGALLALLGSLALLLLSQGSPTKLVGALVFGLTMTLMYVASTLYHALRVPQSTLLWLRRLDHAAIFLFIAGTYTPVLLLALEATWRPWALGLVWGLAGLGAAQRLISLETPRWLYTAGYLALGWLSIFLLPKLLLSPLALGGLLGGGLAYSLGAAVYAAKWPNPLPQRVGFHGLWHLFVLLGSLGMYLAVLALYL